MRIAIFCLLLFAIYNSVSAQPIFIPFKGERQIQKANEMKNEVPEISIPCGDYFWYEVIKDSDGKLQKIIRFKVPGIETDSPGTNDYVIIDQSLVKIKIDDEIEIPTARWDIKKKRKRNMIIRISNKDYQAANCVLQRQ